MEISFLNNIKKYNSNMNKKNISNVINEAFRETQEYKNNVNNNLTQQNIVLHKDFDVLQRQYFDTEVSNNSKDVISVVSTLHCKEFEAQNNVDLTYLLSQHCWQKYYEENLEFLKNKLGKNAKCVYATIHFDEATPHLHTMFTFSEENIKNNEINYEKVKSALSSAFSRYNKKELHLTATTKEYRKAFEEFKKENEPKIIKKQLEKNQKKEITKKFKYETSTSALNRDFYKNFNQDFVDFIQKNKQLQEIKRKIELISNENCDIVVKRTERTTVFEDLDRNKKSIKEKIKIFENKVENSTITEKEKEIYKMMLSKQSLINEKKNINLEDYLKKFEEINLQCKVFEKNKNIRDFTQKVKDVVTLKKIQHLGENKTKEMFKKDLKKLEKNIKSSVDIEEIIKIENEVKKLVRNEEYIVKNEVLKNGNETLISENNNLKIENKELKKEVEEVKSIIKQAKTLQNEVLNRSIEILQKNEIEKIKNNKNEFEEIKKQAKNTVIKSVEAKMYQKIGDLNNEKNKENAILTKKIEILKNEIDNLIVRKKEFEAECENITEAEIKRIKEKIVKESFTIDNFFEFLDRNQQQKLAFEEEMREYIKKAMKYGIYEEYDNLKYIFEKLVEKICYEAEIKEYFDIEKLIENFVENNFDYNVVDTESFIFYLTKDIEKIINQKNEEKNSTKNKINDLKKNIVSKNKNNIPKKR